MVKPKSLDSVTEISPRWNSASFPRKLIRLLGIGNVSRFLPVGLRLCDRSVLLVVVIYMKRLTKFAHYLTGRLRCTPCRNTPALKPPFPLSVSSTEEQITVRISVADISILKEKNDVWIDGFYTTEIYVKREKRNARARSLGSLYKIHLIHDETF